MTFQYLSDLHLEMPANGNYFIRKPLPKEADILIMAGDIMNYELKDERFLDHISKTFEKVYWIPGNHEHYGGELLPESSFNIPVRDNVHYLNNQSITLGDISFLFSTLWSEISPLYSLVITEQLNDFKAIKYKGKLLTVPEYNKLHQTSVTFLEEGFKRLSGKVAVITHYAPVYHSTQQPQFLNSVLASAFHSELSDMILNYNPAVWVYGHTHYIASDLQIGETVITSNQFGYLNRKGELPFASSNFNPRKTYTI